MVKDVTDAVQFGEIDGEALPLSKCVCGAKWHPWDGPILSVYADDPTECLNCGRKFYFTNTIRVLEVDT